jgi:hypothetical protein
MSIVCLEWQLDVIENGRFAKKRRSMRIYWEGLRTSWSFAARDLQVATTSSNLSVNAMSNSRHYV